MLTFGEELKRLAAASGYETQQKLADAAGVSQQTIAALYLNKNLGVSAIIIYRLSSVLNVSSEHFRPFLMNEEPNVKRKGRQPKATAPKKASVPKKKSG